MRQKSIATVPLMQVEKKSLELGEVKRRHLLVEDKMEEQKKILVMKLEEVLYIEVIAFNSFSISVSLLYQTTSLCNPLTIVQTSPAALTAI